MEVKPGYKQTEVGVIPEDWDARPLSAIGQFKNGINKSSEAFGHGSPFVNLMDVFGVSSIKAGDELGLVETTEAEQKTYDLRRGDVLFIRSSVKPSGVGLTAVVEADIPKTVYSGFLLRFRDSDALDLGFKRHCFYAEKFRSKLIGASSVSANTNINQDNLKKLLIALPPTLPEQRAIATALSDVDGLLGGLDRLIAKKRDLKQAAMQQLLTGQTRLPGFSGEWRNTTLGQIISRFSTGLNPRQNFRLNSGGNFFYVTIKNFAVGQLFLDENCDLIDEAAFWRINERSDLRKDDILFSSIGRVGDAYLITETPRNWNINESVFTLRPDKSQVVPLMLFYLLTDKTVTDALSQGVTGSTFKSIKQAQLRAIPCQLPASLEEQTAIASVLTEMDGELAGLEQRREKTRALKQAMMQELLTGRTRLVSPEVAHA